LGTGKVDLRRLKELALAKALSAGTNPAGK